MTPELNAETQALYDAAQGNFQRPDAAPEEPGSLADHEAEFSNAPRVVEADDEPIAQPRHKAKSQRATPDDVEKINALTQRLRAAESDLGVKAEREDGESERVYNLRKRTELAEAVRAAKQASSAPRPATTPTPIPAPPQFAEAEPTIDKFADKEDPYSSWTRAVAAWDRRKEAFDGQQQQAAQAPQREMAATNARIETAYKAGALEFVKTAPDFNAVVAAAAHKPTPPALFSAIMSDPANGPRWAYLMAKSDDLFDDLFSFTVNLPFSPETVAMVQRRLKARMPAADTGSAAPQTRPITPRPPNPVRTVPTARPASRPPGETASLSDHERAYPVSRR